MQSASKKSKNEGDWNVQVTLPSEYLKKKTSSVETKKNIRIKIAYIENNVKIKKNK